MTLPSATALYINPSDFIPKGDGHALRKRLMSAKRQPVKREEGKVEVRVVYSRPTRKWNQQHDEHVKDWREHLKLIHERPEAFIKRRCAEMGVSYRDVAKSSSRFKEHAEPRQMLMAEVRERYGMSFPAIGRLFGGRDHTTTIHACRKNGIEAGVRRRLADHHDKIKEMFDAGNSDYVIGAAVSFTHVAVWAYRRKQGWTR